MNERPKWMPSNSERDNAGRKYLETGNFAFMEEVEIRTGLRAQLAVLEELSAEGWNSEDTQESIAQKTAAIRKELGK